MEYASEEVGKATVFVPRLSPIAGVLQVLLLLNSVTDLVTSWYKQAVS